MEFTHFDKKGNAIMVDVTEKNITSRTAIAEGSILVSDEIMQAVTEQKVKKGEKAEEPKLSPTENGAWDYDFSTKVNKNLTVVWIEK